MAKKKRKKDEKTLSEHVVRFMCLREGVRVIPINVILLELAGSSDAALMLAQACYWQSKMEKKDKPWWYKQAWDWEQETRLTSRQQERARKRLRAKGVLLEKREGLPCMLYFRVDWLQFFKEFLLAADRCEEAGCFQKYNDEKQYCLQEATKGIKSYIEKQETNRPENLLDDPSVSPNGGTGSTKRCNRVHQTVKLDPPNGGTSVEYMPGKYQGEYQESTSCLPSADHGRLRHREDKILGTTKDGVFSSTESDEVEFEHQSSVPCSISEKSKNSIATKSIPPNEEVASQKSSAPLYDALSHPSSKHQNSTPQSSEGDPSIHRTNPRSDVQSLDPMVTPSDRKSVSSLDRKRTDGPADQVGSADLPIEPRPSTAPNSRLSAEQAAQYLAKQGLDATKLKVNAALSRRTEKAEAKKTNRAKQRAFDSVNEEAARDKMRHSPSRHEIGAQNGGNKARGHTSKKAKARKDEVPYLEEFDEPPAGCSFEAATSWASSRIHRRKIDGGGLRPAEEWTGKDLAQYHADLIEKAMDLDRPGINRKIGAMAKSLLETIGGKEAKKLIDFSVQNWGWVRKQLDIKGQVPTFNILHGYLENIRALARGKRAKVRGPNAASLPGSRERKRKTGFV